MLSLISSIKATIPEVGIDSCYENHKPLIEDSDTYALFDDQKRENELSVSTSPKLKDKLTYFSVKSNNKEYFHSFQGINEWEEFDGVLSYSNEEDNTREYLYYPGNNQIYNKSTKRTTGRKHQSPVIQMVEDGDLKAQILVNDPIISTFDPTLVVRGHYSLFLTLFQNKDEVNVSSLIYFFKFNNAIYCSVQEMKFGFSLERVKRIIKETWQGFIEVCVLKCSNEVSECVVKQVELILECGDCLVSLVNLVDVADLVNTVDVSNKKPSGKSTININRGNVYDGKLWQPQNLENIGACSGNHLYSEGDQMMTSSGFYPDSLGNELLLIWKIISLGTINTLEILSLDSSKYYSGNIACERVFTNYSDQHTVQKKEYEQTTVEKKKYVFFRHEGYKKTIFCMKYVDDVCETVYDCDIYEIRFILETTNVFYSLTHNNSVYKRPLLSIFEDSEISSNVEDSKNNISEYEMEEKTFLNSTEECTLNEKGNTLEPDSTLPIQEEVTPSNDLNIFFVNDLNTTKEGEEIIYVCLDTSSISEEEVTTDSQNTMFMNVCCDNLITLHKIGDHQLELISLNEKVFTSGVVYLMDPINNLVSKDKVVLSVSNDVNTVSIGFSDIEGPFKKVSLIDDIGFIENKKDLHFIPFYFIIKEGDEIKVNRILIFIHSRNCDILYCHGVEVDNHLKEFEELRKENVTKYIGKLKGLANIKSVEETVSILRTTKLFEMLQDRSSYSPFTCTFNVEVLANQFAEEILPNSEGNEQNDSLEYLIKDTNDAETKKNGKSASKSFKSMNFNSLVTTINNFFRIVWGYIRTSLIVA